jgi:hypothetical protein
MARCEQGYLCDVCGTEVAEITDSDLYLRFILGEVSLATLHISRERHIRCNPVMAQFIVAPEFEAVSHQGPFAKEGLDPGSVRETEERVTRAWRRLQHVATLHIPIESYPLPEVRRDRQ